MCFDQPIHISLEISGDEGALNARRKNQKVVFGEGS